MATRLSHRDFDACSCALRELYDETSLQTFPDRLLPLLTRLVPCSYITYNDINELQKRFVLRYHPVRTDAAKMVQQFATHFHTHPLHDYFHEPEEVLKKISDVATLRQFKNTAVYEEYFRLMGTRHQMVFFLPKKENSRVGLSLNREQRDFSERDRSVLAFLAPHIVQAHQNARIADAMAVNLNLLGDGLDAMSRAVILAGADGRIQWQSALAREWLRQFFPDSIPSGERLPPALAKWLKQNENIASQGRTAFSTLHMPAIAGCRLLVYGGRTATGETVLALVRERMEIDAATAQSYGLTPREAEILFWISEAKTRPEIGDILGVSCRTIGKHMEHLFAKLGVENRLEAQRLGQELRKA